MKQVTRTVISSVIECVKVEVVDGKIETKPLKPITILGSRVKQEKATKYVKDTYGKEGTYAVTSIEHKEQLYGLDADIFMKYAKPIIEKEEGKEEEKEEEKTETPTETPAETK